MARGGSGYDEFERNLVFAVEEFVSPAKAGAAMARYAKRELAKAIAAGASPYYETYVGGVKGRPETSVRPPEAIVYEFINWPIVIKSALEELRKRAPRRSGTYAASFLVLANQTPVINGDYSKIPVDAEVIIFNVQPYTRRIEVGANNSKGKRHFDLSRLAVNRRFRGAFRAETRFLNIAGGVHPLVPYILKKSQGRRKDRQAGSPITYPAMVINVDFNG